MCYMSDILKENVFKFGTNTYWDLIGLWSKVKATVTSIICSQKNHKLVEYGVDGLLLWAIQSLYHRSQSLVCITGSKSVLFPVTVGLRQGCPLSKVLFIIFMDRIL